MEFVRHAKPCIHNSENRMFLWVALFSCIMTLVYQLIPRVCMHSFIDAYYPCGPSSHSVLNDLEKQTPVPHPYLGLGQSSCVPQIKLQSSFWSALPWSITFFMTGISWELHHLLWILDIVILLAILFHSSVPCCCSRSADKWIMMCELNTPSNPIAW